MSEYVTSKEDCLFAIIKNNCVCHGCGGEMEPIETVDNSGRPTFWSGCLKCSHFTSGVPPHVFQIAALMVDRGYSKYSHMMWPDGNDEAYAAHYRKSQIGGLAPDVWMILNMDQERREMTNRGEAWPPTNRLTATN